MAKDSQPPAFWLAMALLSTASASAFYTWLWHRPSQFKKLVAPSDPCSAMAKISTAIKLAQFISIYRCVDLSVFSSMPPWQWAWLIVLLGVGQHLNYRVFKLLGEDGVFYGVRFGKNIPWVTAWPYNVMKDPQFVGGLLSLAGVCFVVPKEIVGWWAANYFYMMALESKVPKGQ